MLIPLKNNFVNLKSNIVYAEEKSLSTIDTLCDALGRLDVGKYTKDYNSKLIECLILTFLGCCSQKTSRDFESEIIQKSVMYINAHFRENPKMCDVAEMFHLSDNYFCRLFKKCVGISYKEYVKKLKLDYGFKLIKNTDLPITDIASNCGYETQSHFNREFKKQFQAPPSFFRSV